MNARWCSCAWFKMLNTCLTPEVLQLGPGTNATGADPGGNCVTTCNEEEAAGQEGQAHTRAAARSQQQQCGGGGAATAAPSADARREDHGSSRVRAQTEGGQRLQRPQQKRPTAARPGRCGRPHPTPREQSKAQRAARGSHNRWLRSTSERARTRAVHEI
jgi:hypothetical protein